MPKVSVIIPTCNRPDLVEKAIQSVLNQTYQDFEIILVDDGELSVEEVVKSLSDKRIRYIKHPERKGGGAARNTGIKNAGGEFVAFLDDDDEWLEEKLEIQIGALSNTPPEVGFCFSAVKNFYSDSKTEDTTVPEGIGDYHERALTRFSGFLTVTLVIKREVFTKAGMFDESFPSHQEPDLMIRVTKSFQGIGINRPLVKVNMKKGHAHINSNILNRIKGREMILEKYKDEYLKTPIVLAKHYFGLGLLFRDAGFFGQAEVYFLKSIKLDFKRRYLFHWISMARDGFFYNLLVNKKNASN